MRIFGRKAKKQPTSELPPELKQYYRPPLKSRLKHIGLLILPLIAVIVVGCALVGGGLWMASHFGAFKQPPQITKNTGPAHPAHPANQTPAPKIQPQPVPQSTAPTSQPSPATPVAPPSLVNTGPSPLTIVLPVVAAALSMALFELRGRRSARE